MTKLLNVSWYVIKYDKIKFLQRANIMIMYISPLRSSWYKEDTGLHLVVLLWHGNRYSKRDTVRNKEKLGCLNYTNSVVKLFATETICNENEFVLEKFRLVSSVWFFNRKRFPLQDMCLEFLTCKESSRGLSLGSLVFRERDSVHWMSSAT